MVWRVQVREGKGQVVERLYREVCCWSLSQCCPVTAVALALFAAFGSGAIGRQPYRLSTRA